MSCITDYRIICSHGRGLWYWPKDMHPSLNVIDDIICINSSLSYTKGYTSVFAL